MPQLTFYKIFLHTRWHAIIGFALFLIVKSSYAQKSYDQNWLDNFRNEALAAGIKPETFDKAFDGISILPKVINLDQQQPEFLQTFVEYYGVRVNQKLLDQAKNLRIQNKILLKDIYQTYQVPEQYLLAFWGLESNFSKITGNFSIIQALFTLAVDGRREKFFKQQLLASLKILERRLIPFIEPKSFKSSWAGAFGAMQFMPTTFLEYAVDTNNDQKVDLWNNTEEIFASAANYLQKMGWDKNTTWGQQVVLPSTFLYHEAEINNIKPLDQWTKQGIKPATGKSFPNNNPNTAIILPMGKFGPAFAVYPNFFLILKWNNSISYALSVGLFADQIIGYQGIVWKKHDGYRPITIKEIYLIQCYLKEKGLLADQVDGRLGLQTRSAIRLIQHEQHLIADGFPDQQLLAYVIKNQKTCIE